MLALIGSAIALAIGCGLTLVICPELFRSLAGKLFGGAVSIAIGLGTTSCTFFLAHHSLGLRAWVAFGLEVVLLLGLAALVWRRRLAIREIWAGAVPGIPGKTGLAERLALVGFAIAAIAYVASFVGITIHNHHGRWDAWAIWNLRASFLHQGGDQWADGFSNFVGWAHPDYPLHIPSSVARLWHLVGSDSWTAPAGVAFGFGAACVIAIAAGVSLLRSRVHGVLAVMVLFGSARFVQLSFAQYADVPLAFLIATTLMLLALWDSGRVSDKGCLVLAGITAGLCAWTKNEGVAFVAVLVFVRLLTSPWRSDLRRARSEAQAFLVGLVPVGAVVAFFKTRYAPTNDLLIGSSSSDVFGRMLDVSRLVEVAGLCARELSKFENGWIILLLLILILKGVRIGDDLRRSVLRIGMAILGMCVIYFFVFVASPYNVAWHITTALLRLVLHLWPATLVIYFLCVGDLTQPGWIARLLRRPRPESGTRNRGLMP